ncbi:serine/threonine-protein kinase [Planosporangium sp. 12N6]|uniref:serine/threonine-protein kinase n=1 Tax=Planosporangium spinosum TaxID=3402278 RepID=UPI003CF1881B
MTDPRTTMPTVPGLTGLSVLARGGYATVYRAVQESVGRDVAVKVENRRLESGRDQERFLREARAAGRMSGHPNVIDLFDAGVTASGHPYLIMELCEASYADRMKTNPLSPVEARDVGVKIGDALADAHALGVLHRDVKPANLLISRFGEPQLADFGLAVLVEARDHAITLDVLTPAYAPPEMFRYAPPSPAADVYALCATLYALMRGRPPRWRDDVNPTLVSMAGMFGAPIPDVPGVPPELMSLLRAGMANDERQRPSAVELRDALVALEFDLGGARPAAPSRRPVFGPPSFGPSGSASTTLPAASTTLPAASTTLPAADATLAEVTAEVSAAEVTAAVSAAEVATGADTAAGARRRMWLGFAAGCLVLVMLVSAVSWYARHTTPSSKPQSPARPSRTAAGSAGGTAADSCGLTANLPGLRCPATPECFGPVGVDGGVAHAAPTGCDGTHAAEVFALGELPATVTGVDYLQVSNDPYVRSACSGRTLAHVGAGSVDWRVDVLPPTSDAFRAGDRTFRCVAGPATGTSTGSKFARGR